MALFPSLTYHKRLTFSTLYAISQSLALNLNDEKIKKIAGSLWISVPTDAYKMVYRYCSSQAMTVQQTIKSYNSAELRGLKLILKVPDVVQSHGNVNKIQALCNQFKLMMGCSIPWS